MDPNRFLFWIETVLSLIMMILIRFLSIADCK